MAEFLLSVHHDYSRPLVDPDTDVEQMFADVAALNGELEDAGAMVYAGGLDVPTTARVVEPDGVVTDGPRSDGTLIMGGFWVIEAEDTEAALAWARRAAAATRGPVEVRPFQG